MACCGDRIPLSLYIAQNVCTMTHVPKVACKSRVAPAGVMCNDVPMASGGKHKCGECTG